MLTPVPVRPEQPIRNIETLAQQTLALAKRDSLETELAKVSYFSPVTRIDVETQTAVLQYRNAETGQLIRQYPSEKHIQAYQRAASLDQLKVDNFEQDEENAESSRDETQDDTADPEQMKHVLVIA